VQSSIYDPYLARGLGSGRAISITREASCVMLSLDVFNPIQNMVSLKIRNLFVVFLLLLVWYYSLVRFKNSRFPGVRIWGSHSGDYEKRRLLGCEGRSYLLA
jgi:uncharacterized RDD family membrane protein YckC